MKKLCRLENLYNSELPLRKSIILSILANASVVTVSAALKLYM